jgi:hypothetical protein
MYICQQISYVARQERALVGNHGQDDPWAETKEARSLRPARIPSFPVIHLQEAFHF